MNQNFIELKLLNGAYINVNLSYIVSFQPIPQPKVTGTRITLITGLDLDVTQSYIDIKCLVTNSKICSPL